jgi:hypothetical protein
VSEPAVSEPAVSETAVSEPAVSEPVALKPPPRRQVTRRFVARKAATTPDASESAEISRATVDESTGRPDATRGIDPSRTHPVNAAADEAQAEQLRKYSAQFAALWEAAGSAGTADVLSTPHHKTTPAGASEGEVAPPVAQAEPKVAVLTSATVIVEDTSAASDDDGSLAEADDGFGDRIEDAHSEDAHSEAAHLGPGHPADEAAPVADADRADTDRADTDWADTDRADEDLAQQELVDLEIADLELTDLELTDLELDRPESDRSEPGGAAKAGPAEYAATSEYGPADTPSVAEPAVVGTRPTGTRPTDTRPTDTATGTTAVVDVPGSGQPTTSATSGGSSNRDSGPRRLVGTSMAAVIVLVLAVIGVGIGIAVSRSGDSKPAGAVGGQAVTTSSTAAGSNSTGSVTATSASTDPSAGNGNSDVPEPVAQQRDLLDAWVGANLSRSAVIVADPTTVTALKLAGFSNARADTALAGIDRQSVDYLVSVPSSDTQSTERNELAEASAKLAIFSAGTDAVSISQVFPQGSPDLQKRRANNLGARRIAANQLPANPAIQFMGTTKSVIQSANVDLRAMTVLVVLGQQGTVWVRDISLDTSEERAGQPARTLTITVADSQTAQTILSALPVLYRPLGIVAVSPGTLRLIWAPAVAPVVTDG